MLSRNVRFFQTFWDMFQISFFLYILFHSSLKLDIGHIVRYYDGVSIHSVELISIECFNTQASWFIFFFKINSSLRSQQSCYDSCPECGFRWALPAEGLHWSCHRSGFRPPRLLPVGLCRWSWQPDGLAAHLHWQQDTVSWHVGDTECVGRCAGLCVCLV